MDCFAAVRKRANSQDPLLVRANAVLEALGAVIVARKQAAGAANPHGPPSPLELVAVLFLSLDRQSDAADPAEAQRVAATLYLLSLALPQAPRAALVARFADFEQILSHRLADFTADAACARHALACATQLLLQVEGAMWAQVYVQRLLRSLLVLALDERPKVRKLAQQGVSQTLAHAAATRKALPKPVAEMLAQWCRSETEACSRKVRRAPRRQ